MNKKITTILLLLLSLTACNNNKKINTNNTKTSIEEVKITDTVTAELKVSDIAILEENVPLDSRSLRVRMLNVVPGGVIGLHSHENRPAILSMAQGGMTVYAYQKDPVVINYGESYKEYNSVIHYATNNSKTDTLSIISFDFLDESTVAHDGKTKNEQHLPLLDELKKNNDPFYVNAPKSIEDETNHPFYSIKLEDIKLPEGSSALKDRSLRVRRISLDKGASTGVQNFSNRPSYIVALEGNIDIKNIDANTNTKLLPREAGNLVNVNQAEITNIGTDKAVYLLLELRDLKDADTL